MYKDCQITFQKEICPNIFVMTLDIGNMADATMPGQFVMIKSWSGRDPFLMRPISVNSVDRKAGKMTLLYTVKGKGTQLLSQLNQGDTVQLIGPLGSSFPILPDAKRVALIGRGIGIAPLLLLAQDYAAQGTELFVYLSGNTEESLYDLKAFEYLGATVRTSINPNEVITDKMAEDCKEAPFDAAYSCGSKRLARGMKDLSEEYDFPAYVSLEQHMACGIGACKGCVCKATNQETGEVYYPRVCKEGPVFPVAQVIEEIK